MGAEGSVASGLITILVTALIAAVVRSGGTWDDVVAAAFAGGRPATFWLSHAFSLALILALAYGTGWVWDRFCEARWTRIVVALIDWSFRVAAPTGRVRRKAVGMTRGGARPT